MSELIIQWTASAREQVDRMDDSKFEGDAKAWHERKVREHARTTVPEATRARIRFSVFHPILRRVD